MLPSWWTPNGVGVEWPAAVLALLCLVPFAVSWRDVSRGRWQPIHLFALVVLVSYSARAPFALLDGEAGYVFGAFAYDHYLGPALWYMCAGWAACMVGYYAGPGRTLGRSVPELSPPWPSRFPALAVLVLIAVGVLGTAAGVRAGNIAGADEANRTAVSSSTYLLLLTWRVLAFATEISGIYLLAGRRQPWWCAACFATALIGNLAQAFLFGGKIFLLEPVLVLGLSAVLIRRVRHVVPKAVLAVALILAFATVLNAFRVHIQAYGGSDRLDAVAFVSAAGDAVAQVAAGDSTLLQQFQSAVLRRMHGVDSLALLMTTYPTWRPYEGWSETLSLWAVGLVPRALWPGKPTGGKGIEFGRDFIVDPAYASLSYAAFGVFHPGDFYRSGGFVGLVVAMWVFGVLVRALYEFARLGEGVAPGRLFVYVNLVLALLLGFEGEAALAIAATVKFVIVLLGVHGLVVMSGTAVRAWDAWAHGPGSPGGSPGPRQEGTI